MNENKENVKVLTKDDVIKLSNNSKRQEFLSNYESWGVWLDIPEVNVQIFKAELPNNRVIYVTRFKSYTTFGGEYASPIYRISQRGDEYKSYPESMAFVVDKLKELKTLLLSEVKKNES